MNVTFVFGSNIRGFHGAGAALYAVASYGAVEGLGVGFCPTPGFKGYSYALPTCVYPGKPLPLNVIANYVEQFNYFANMTKRAAVDIMFKVTRVGCGLAGFKNEQIAPLFVHSDPAMCEFDLAWKPWLGNKYRYWTSS